MFLRLVLQSYFSLLILRGNHLLSMLTSLSIQNLALVESLKWNINSGLTAITGETGAGKSVIIGALKLITGARAEKSMIRTGEEKATLNGVFELENPSEVNVVLEEAGMPPCEEGALFLRRLISQKGSKQFINDEPCTLNTMKKLGELLMDLHGPHDHQSLFSNERQLNLLDRYAGNQVNLDHYRGLWQSFAVYRREYEEFLESEMLSPEELDLYRFQLDEIQSANLGSEDLEELETSYRRAQNASTLAQTAQQLTSLLTGDVVDQLNELVKHSRDLIDLDSSLESELAPVESALIELQEVEGSLRLYLDRLDTDPSSHAELEERVNLVESLKRKYGNSQEEILLHAERIEKKLNQTEERESVLAEFEGGLAKHQKALQESASKLSKKRRSSAPKLAKEITKHLQDLGFKQAIFDLLLTDLDEPNASGVEFLEFTFGPNPGEPSKPLKQIASSGEMSRVLLALKSSLAEHDEMPLLVFDEIDANVGGEIATAVGNKMKALSAKRQVMSITHFPQVAAVAPTHMLVSKHTESGRTRSQITAVEKQDRINELVRMLGSSGEEAEALAQTLLEA